MRLLRTLTAEFAMSFLKVLVMGGYSVWAIKLGIVDSGTNPLFALAMVLLSIYGLWVIVRRASEYLVGVIEGIGERDAVPKA